MRSTTHHLPSGPPLIAQLPPKLRSIPLGPSAAYTADPPGGEAGPKTPVENGWDKITTARVVFAAPSWLVSMSLHLVMLLTFALLAIPQAARSLTICLEATPDQNAEAGLSLVTVEIEAMKVEPEPTAEAVSTSELAMPAISEVDGQFGAQVAAVPAGDTGGSPLAGIGDLLLAGGGSSGGRLAGNRLGDGSNLAAHFFGVRAGGQRFVFIVDSSGSMHGDKFSTAKAELLYAISHLSSSQAFYVIFFDNQTKQMILPPENKPPLLPVPATRQTKQQARSWIDSVETGNDTYPYDAVRLAVEMLPDAIYLLSDGKFGDGGQTEQFLRDNNVVDNLIDGRHPKVIVHTIAFWDRDGAEALERIAQQNGGKYRFIPRGGR